MIELWARYRLTLKLGDDELLEAAESRHEVLSG